MKLSITDRALRLLILTKRPLTAGEFGEALWGRLKRKRVASVNGGGDYAAQMLLGRLRKAGLVRTVPQKGPGASIWELTDKGALRGAQVVAERGAGLFRFW